MEKEKKPLLSLIENRTGIIIGFISILLSFILLISFYLLQSPILDAGGVYRPQKIYKPLFIIAVVFGIIGVVLFETYLIRNIKSLRFINKWTWRDKNKLQRSLIVFPSISFFVLIVFVFGSLFITGSTMSSYGYNGFTKIYIDIIYPLTALSFLACSILFSPWINTTLFEKIILKHGDN